MTHDDHDQTLAAIEQRLLACGTPLEDIDARIAEVLGVPVDYYFAYRLVAGAIEAQHRPATEPAHCDLVEASAALLHARTVADSIGTLTAAIFRAATGSGTHREVASHAAHLTALRLVLSEQLRRAAALANPIAAGQLQLPATGGGAS